MTMTQAVRTCLRKYFTFKGRATRPEYWYFVLFCLLGALVLGLVDSALFGSPDPMTNSSANGPLTALFNFATLVP
jgi:uncharacterized membrane protein YhaH (DUF805 family)